MRYMVVIEKGYSAETTSQSTWLSNDDSQVAGYSYGAFVPDFLGCVAVGETETEALALIEEAIQFHLEDMKAGRVQIPPPASKSAFVEVALAA